MASHFLSAHNNGMGVLIGGAGGFVTAQAVAKAHQMEYHELKGILDDCPEFED